jgi:hypothetical protein
MQKTNILRVQQLVDKIDSCKNPREARSWLHNLRSAVKEADFGKLPQNLAESVYKIEETRGDSNKRTKRMGAFVAGFDGFSNDYVTLVDGIKSALYDSQDVSKVFNRQIDASLYNCSQDQFDGSINWNGPQHYFAGLVSQGVISQDQVGQAISKQQLKKLQKGFEYDTTRVQMGLEAGHLEAEDVAQAALGALITRDQIAQQDLVDSFKRQNEFNNSNFEEIIKPLKNFEEKNEFSNFINLEKNLNFEEKIFYKN